MRFIPNLLLVATLAFAAAASRAGDKKSVEPPLVFQEDFTKGAGRWEPTDPQAWQIVKGDKGSVYSQFRMSKYTPPFRSPHNISLVKDKVVGDLVLDAWAQSTGKDGPHRDMCLFFGYLDPAHFYYVHIAKRADDHANQIFIVNGEARKKISTKSTAGTAWDDMWHHLRISRSVADGRIAVFFDDMKEPIMTAQDKTFTWGRVGIGSFDDSGNWKEITLRGVLVKK